MVLVLFRHGFLRRKVKFTFDLAALRRATLACSLDLGEFYSDEKVSDDHRTFYYSYGAWLNGREHNNKLFIKYARMYKRFNYEQLSKIKAGVQSAGIISAELKNLIEQTSPNEKKNS